MGWPSCHIWCEAALGRQWVQMPCAAIGDIEKVRVPLSLQMPSSVKSQSRHLNSVFIVDVLWLPPHTGLERRKRARTSIGGGGLRWGSLAILVKMMQCSLICKQSVISKGRNNTDLGETFFVPSPLFSLDVRLTMRGDSVGWIFGWILSLSLPRSCRIGIGPHPCQGYGIWCLLKVMDMRWGLHNERMKMEETKATDLMLTCFGNRSNRVQVQKLGRTKVVTNSRSS